MQLTLNQMEFPTLEAAWEGINEYMANHETEVRAKGGAAYGTEMVIYDTFIHAFKAYVSPDFDFGKILGYKYKKWSKLINNYVNFNYLDLVKSEVLARENKKSSHYNYTFHFDNAHGSGKDCLISLSFARRKGQKTPFVIYTTRASEVTSRLIFDFLLIQRICEYVYGVEKASQVDVVCYIPFCYVNIERYLIYMAYKGRDEAIYPSVLGPNGKVKFGKREYTPFQTKCLNKYDEFLKKPLDSIRYKVHRRSAAQVQKDENGYPLAGAPQLLAKDLTLPYRKVLKEKDIAKLNASVPK